MFFRIHWIIFSWFVQELFCLDQTCTFGTGMPSATNMDEIPTKSYYFCKINSAQLLNESVPVNTITINNTKSNSEVQLVSYVLNNNVKFIPNSLFKIFPNVEYFCITYREGIVVLKPRFLKGAKNLKVFYVYQNNIISLEEDLFIEAPNLQHINLKNNLIESVHISTFKGLSNLEGLYLQGNKIVNLHPNTFYVLLKLKSLNLTSNRCINTFFAILETSHIIIATEIKKTCMYDDLSLISSLTQINSTILKIQTRSETTFNIANKINTKFDKLNDDFSALNATNLKIIKTILEKTTSNITNKINKEFDKLNDDFKVAKLNDHVLNSQRNFQFHILIGLFSLVALILTVLGVVGIAIIIKNILRKHKLPKNESGNDIELDSFSN